MSKANCMNTNTCTYRRDICKARMPTAETLMRHKISHLENVEGRMLVHSEVGKHGCYVCGRYFKHVQELKNHKLTHEDEESYSCSICSKRFGRKENLERNMVSHSENMEDGEETQNECDFCAKQFTDSKDLRVHSLIHGGEDQYECGICGKRFASQES